MIVTVEQLDAAREAGRDRRARARDAALAWVRHAMVVQTWPALGLGRVIMVDKQGDWSWREDGDKADE